MLVTREASVYMYCVADSKTTSDVGVPQECTHHTHRKQYTSKQRQHFKQGYARVAIVEGKGVGLTGVGYWGNGGRVE
jgi:hypothetical protein